MRQKWSHSSSPKAAWLKIESCPFTGLVHLSDQRKELLPHHIISHFWFCSKRADLCKWCVRTAPSKWQEWLKRKLRSWSFHMPVESWACWCCCLMTSLAWSRYGPGRASRRFMTSVELGCCQTFCWPLTSQLPTPWLCWAGRGAQNLPRCFQVLRQSLLGESWTQFYKMKVKQCRAAAALQKRMAIWAVLQN